MPATGAQPTTAQGLLGAGACGEGVSDTALNLMDEGSAMSDDDGYDEEPGSRRPYEGSSGIPFAARALVVLVPTITVPATIVVTAAALFIVERRRVRGRWWATWAALSFLIGLAVSGSLLGWLLQPLRLPAWLITALTGVSPAAAVSGVDGPLGPTLRDIATSAAPAAILGQILFALPVGFAITAVFTRVRRFKREKLGEIEGPEFSNWRPVGTLDRLRARRVTGQIRSGDHTIAPTARTTS